MPAEKKQQLTAVKTAPKQAVVYPRALTKPSVVVGFVDFLREQSVVGLAVGLVIGTQVKALADQLINSFINPLLGLVLPGTGALNSKVFAVHLGHKAAAFAWGAFVAVALSFLTTAAVVYFVFKALKLDSLAKKKDAK
jgi:large conductance mechanosensitive channel